MLKKLFNVFVVTFAFTASSLAFSGTNDPLFINLSTDDVSRASMAINFGRHHFSTGHPLTIFLNDKAVMLGVKAGSSKYAEQQQALSEAITAGALVIMCPIC
jgi:hypothetical protein